MSSSHVKLKYKNELKESVKVAFELAAKRLNQVLQYHVREQPLIIEVKVHPIDGEYNVLGQAGPTHFCYPEICNPDDGLPTYGIMEFDSVDMERMRFENSLFDVILHEMLHVCGFGTLWEYNRLLKTGSDGKPYFIGWQALVEYQNLGGSTLIGVPVEDGGGEGTANSHWDEGVFQHEIGSGYLSNVNNPLSRVTIGSLADLGYVWIILRLIFTSYLKIISDI